ncbi:MAG: asparagine synthase (glutamine-hydrolyzing) [Elusimicrobia bacterium RIFOXYA12_FULL_51_18]|nr:MAG: asparagine synthase (glutamine-hydrolyzing) [Elusimicrobia bacterium RIFOXYA12_FULL_51_18]OGS28337.1 MAG: asparagine synthase (glutamine-hydrolyzing) [Elusimicrobia bacterium RIFOXYA2_FULL_53_38]
MCGICGFAGYKNDALLRAMAGSLAHRGPDEDGFFTEEARVSLGMRRLKIIDLATGSQPVVSEDGAVVVVFNGEIYNFRELRRELETAGHRFKTNSDTEVLVHLYEEHGEEFPKLLRGMFAFALWDAKERKLLLGRDQFGIKPLYYALSGGKLYFASELKALRLAAGLCEELDSAALDHYFTRLYIPAPLTVYKGVSKLEPASLLVFRNGAARVEKYWRLETGVKSERPEEFYIEGIRELLSKSVKEQLVSDVPLGLLLSGGMDSVSLLAFMAEDTGAGVKAFTAGFAGEAAGFDETASARAAAKHFGAEHFEIPVRADIGAVIKELAGHFDEPFADSSAIANYLVTKEARRSVTVALAGIGGDELFGGYPRHLGARFMPAYLKTPAALRRLASGAAGLLPESRSAFNPAGRFKRFMRGGTSDFGTAYDSWMSYLDGEEKKNFYSGELLAAVSAAGSGFEDLPQNPEDIFGFELAHYLPDDLLCLADRASMANSLELRVPFTDVRLVEFMARVPLAVKTRGFRLKYLLKKTMAGKLPSEVLKGPKRGFQVPLARWQEKELKAFTSEVLSARNVKSAGILSPEGVERMISEHASGRRNLYDRIHAASVFHLWLEHSRRNPPATISGLWNVRGRRKILLVNLAGLGDIIMMTPALRAIRAAYPDTRVELLTIDRSKELAEGIPGIDRIHSVPINFRLAGPLEIYVFIRTLLALRRERFDALVNFSLVSSLAGLLKARMINMITGPALACCRVLKGLGAAGDFTVFEEFIEEKSEVALISRLLAPLGLAPRDLEISYAPGFEEKKKVAAGLAEFGVSGRPVIGFNPGAFRPSRRWPLEKWKGLAELTLKKYPGAVIIVTGSAQEKGLAADLKISDRVFPAAGLYSVRENAALYGLMDVFITNDTGPMHIAAAAGTKTVCIFGPGDHRRFSPSVPEARRRVVRKDIPGCCIPCYKFKCRNPECLDIISPEEVLAATEELLK